MRTATLTAVLLVLVLMVFGTIAAASKFYVPENVYAPFAKKYGTQAETRLNALLELMDGLSDAADDKKVIEVNKFFNQVQYQTDMKTWGQSDYLGKQTGISRSWCGRLRRLRSFKVSDSHSARSCTGKAFPHIR